MVGTQVAPVFVVGFARSGTTLLQALLGAHSRIAAPPESAFFSRIWRFRERWGDLHDDGVLRQVIEATVTRPLLQDCGFEVDALHAAALPGPRTYASVLERVMDDYAQRQGKVRWSEKTPSQHPTLIWQHFPNAKVVHIVRDPRETVVSNLRAPWVDQSAIRIARAWRAFTQSSVYAGGERGPAHYLRVRYEDLAHDPCATMRLVCAFLGETFEPEMISDLSRRKSVLPANVSMKQLTGALEEVKPREPTWRRDLKPLLRSRIAHIVEPLLPGLGYQVPSRKTLVVGASLNAVCKPTDRLAEWRVRRAVKRAGVAQTKTLPALTGSATPVQARDRSLAKKRTVSAISSDVGM